MTNVLRSHFIWTLLTKKTFQG